MAVLAFPEVQSLDVIGPLEVFTSATHWLGRDPASVVVFWALAIFISWSRAPFE